MLLWKFFTLLNLFFVSDTFFHVSIFKKVRQNGIYFLSVEITLQKCVTTLNSLIFGLRRIYEMCMWYLTWKQEASLDRKIDFALTWKQEASLDRNLISLQLENKRQVWVEHLISLQLENKRQV